MVNWEDREVKELLLRAESEVNPTPFRFAALLRHRASEDLQPLIVPCVR